MNDQRIAHPVNSRRAIVSIFMAFVVVAIVMLGIYLLFEFAAMSPVANSPEPALMGGRILLRTLAVAFVLSVAGVVLSSTAFRDPACKKLLPVIGLVFNGMAIIVIALGAAWLNVQLQLLNAL